VLSALEIYKSQVQRLEIVSSQFAVPDVFGSSREKILFKNCACLQEE